MITKSNSLNSSCPRGGWLTSWYFSVESFQRLSVKYLMQKVFGSLVVNTMNEQAHRREIEQVKNKCVVRWKSGQVAGAFDKWHASCARREELKRKFAKIIQRWKNMGIFVSFSTWAALTAHIKTLHRRMRNIVAKWRNRCTGAAFQRWVEQTAERKRLQNLTFRIFARWKNKIASSVFWAWAGDVPTYVFPFSVDLFKHFLQY